MKRILLAVGLLTGLTAASFADFNELTNDIRSIMRSTVSNISTEMAKNLGFYSGAGNVTPANVSGFPGIKFGLGAGLNVTGTLWRAFFDKNYTGILSGSASSNAIRFDDFAKIFALFPFPYDLAYFKIGIPLMPMDVGVRLGFIPPLALDGGSGTTLTVGEFHFGLEARYNLLELPGGILKLDVRLSYDYESGNFGIVNRTPYTAYTNGVEAGTISAATKLDFGWQGSSIGTKLMAGVNIPFVGSVFAGLGLNLNVGEVTTTMRVNEGTYNNIDLDLMETIRVGYNPLDVRLVGGFNVFFVSLAAEYGLLNNNIAVTFIPFQMAF